MTINKILIAVDDSKTAEHAAVYGFDMARKFNAEVALVNVVEPASITQAGGGDALMSMPLETVGIDDLDMLDIQKNRSANIVESTIKKFAGDLKVTHFTDYGLTADSIISCSKEFNAELIIIGTHNPSGLDRLLSGSIAEQVVRHSHIPVLVVPLVHS